MASSARTVVFNDADLLVPLSAPMSQRRAWNSKIPPPQTNTYIGQLKLLATEIAFLVLAVPVSEKKRVVVYAGAAGGHHIPALASMFPEIQFYLYDPAPFSIEETDQLHIINGLFTNEIAMEWGQRLDVEVIFISDVRTSGETAEEHEAEVSENMAMQALWVDLVRPVYWSLKFRIPYTVIEANQHFRYLSGRLIYQPYPKPFSMELRLLGNRESYMMDYDSRALEQAVFYHNTVVRPERNLYANVVTGNSKPYDDPQFDHGYDCTYFLHGLVRYLEREDKSVTEGEVTALASRLIAETSQGRWTLMQRKEPRRSLIERPRWQRVSSRGYK